MISTDNYSTLFKLSTNSDQIPRVTKQTASGETFYRISYEIVILFGLTELQAQLRWKDANVSIVILLRPSVANITVLRQGLERRSTATVIYDE